LFHREELKELQTKNALSLLTLRSKLLNLPRSSLRDLPFFAVEIAVKANLDLYPFLGNYAGQ
jgi:hypothetical protein